MSMKPLSDILLSLQIRQETMKDIYMGVSPRGSIALMKAAQAHAFTYGRDYVFQMIFKS